MIFQHLLLEILHKFSQERTVSAPYHLLKGKRSGQTVQDVGIFQLHKYFGILPKLARHYYDNEMNYLIDNHLLIVFEDGSYKLSEQLKEQQFNDTSKLPFNGWYYRGNEHIFFARLSLIVQSLSQKKARMMSFIPIQKEQQIQQWVRKFLIDYNYQENNLEEQLLFEMIDSLESTKNTDEMKSILIHRLTGYKMAGVTWQQLSLQHQQTELDIQLLYIASLHCWLDVITKTDSQYPLLKEIAQQIKIEIPLTTSALHTAQLYKKGYTIEQISRYRRLKLSTIEDHIVELAMNDPQFSPEQFVSQADVQMVLQAVDTYNTRKLKVLREVLPHLTYFQIRLILAMGGKD